MDLARKLLALRTKEAPKDTLAPAAAAVCHALPQEHPVANFMDELAKVGAQSWLRRIIFFRHPERIEKVACREGYVGGGRGKEERGGGRARAGHGA